MEKSVPFREALAVWWHIGLLSFGGPAGQIALMHRIIVDEKRWLDESRFLHALNYCMLLPGPEAQQLATYIGWLMHGVKGGLVAGLLFILPGAFAILALSWMYVLLGDLSVVEGLFFGMKAAVLAIVVQALIRIGQRTLKDRLRVAIAAAGFLALFAFGLPFPLVVLGAGVIGYCMARLNAATTLQAQGHHPAPAPATASVTSSVIERGHDSLAVAGTRRAALVCLLLWLGTLAALYVFLGSGNVFTEIASFFSRMAVVTFGGAYAVLSYVAQTGVEQYQWLQPGEMLDGLGLAETTPGPLILVTQFVGFLAAWRQAGIEPSLLAATAGAVLTTWVTFLPCFVWIFAGAPYVEKLRNNHALSAALAAITAVVVGVIANLALWFALNLLFAETLRIETAGLDMLLPIPASINLPELALSTIAFLLLFLVKLRMLQVLGLTAVLGMAWTLLIGA